MTELKTAMSALYAVVNPDGRHEDEIDAYLTLAATEMGITLTHLGPDSLRAEQYTRALRIAKEAK